LNAGNINHQMRARRAAEQATATASHLVHQRALQPGRDADKVLHALAVESGDVFCHALQVLDSPLALQEASEISSRFLGIGIASQVEETGEGFDERNESVNPSGGVLRDIGVG
jgi:hypothetical protein